MIPNSLSRAGPRTNSLTRFTQELNRLVVSGAGIADWAAAAGRLGVGASGVASGARLTALRRPWRTVDSDGALDFDWGFDCDLG